MLKFPFKNHYKNNLTLKKALIPLEPFSNAEIGEVDEWGKRRLAYLIDDEADGFYVLYNFVSGPEFPAELDRVAKITDGVLRSMIIRKES